MEIEGLSRLAVKVLWTMGIIQLLLISINMLCLMEIINKIELIMSYKKYKTEQAQANSTSTTT